MRYVHLSSAVVLMCAGLGGCAQDDYLRTDGLTVGAGDAIAANTAMQVVDPWQYGVQNTKLKVPAQRTSSETSPADYAASAKATTTTSGN
ncbi:hypothetical protein ASD50_19420 [Mesorhizobium sp. Root552]|uniref:hypothetical protein n=1 Tax=Mesorhizobium sp. Root552 TaxID=1736555 RepID=UPI000701023E|nr:hypothetical protein [Mesorhizobium sp. Root552]KQZ28674.1 hypothetical protein ASD50_19420 [Mesorhizobium sp. Root552]